jgi:hypothetical protein
VQQQWQQGVGDADKAPALGQFNEGVASLGLLRTIWAGIGIE